MIWLVPVAAAVLMLSGLALAYVIGAGAVLAFLAAGHGRHLAVLPQQIFSQIDVFALMAMPLFILAGEVMNKGGVTRALIELSMAFVGRLRGGLGHVNIMASVFLSGISGSAVADAAALSNTLVPEMRRIGYKNEYACALTAASSIIGPIIPPSIILIFYGALMNTSVTALFIAGILPGLLLAAALFVTNAFYAWRDDHPRLSREETPRVLPTLRRSAPALMLPAIILGGIVFGLATPTEAAVIAVFAALAAGAFYDGVTVGDVLDSLRRTAVLSGSIFILIAGVVALGHLGSLERIPEAIATAVTDLGLGPMEYLILLNVVFVVVGIVIEPPVALALLVPLLAPVALAQGANPVHLGIVLCFNLCVGMISPPLGGSLAVVAAVGRVNYWALCRAVLPFMMAEIVVLALLVAFPEISLALPRAFGFIG
ncbi:MAG: TRAP transporter large permease [Rhizobiaceae bacterium]|nr:MAG: TRAP transporter large permease [Rhizobiaceae bacterium]CAG1007259.1 Sialic acid TRAP transporter large permease protein SiaM [Rhizobiaceae bacterium]